MLPDARNKLQNQNKLDIIRKVLSACVLVLSIALLATSCRKDDEIVGSTSQHVIYPDPDLGEIKGFFLLNEGNMGSNKSTLDYFDYETGIYSKNIFAERNPGVVKELGDVGNDIQIYGNRLYAVINCSHFVEVMDVNTAKHIDIVSIPNCRYIVFKNKYAYVSSYAGPVQIDPNARLGYVVKVDTASLKVVDECPVGYQPEEMVIVGNKLYVANSGGYRVPNYDNTVSVIDLNTFTEIKKIEVAINLHRLEPDRYGNIWVSSRGDYYGTPSKTFVIDSQTDKVTHEFDLPNSNMTRCGDSLYVYSTEWSYITNQNIITYAIVNTKTKEIVDRNFIKDGTEEKIEIPYGVAVNPVTKEIFVTDAKDYVTPGRLYCYSPKGKLKWSVTTGDIPAHIAFTNKKLQLINN
jgi:DNA-binding beta-propeller fold protein YncE